MITTHDDPRTRQHPKREGATLTTEELRRMYDSGELKPSEMTQEQRERLRAQLKKA